jgi:hypothetical protein
MASGDEGPGVDPADIKVLKQREHEQVIVMAEILGYRIVSRIWQGGRAWPGHIVRQKDTGVLQTYIRERHYMYMQLRNARVPPCAAEVLFFERLLGRSCYTSSKSKRHRGVCCALQLVSIPWTAWLRQEVGC